ncbi:MAG: transporter substrate-binding domain-containing protein, partial [Pseudomonadota bacterium]
MNRVLLLIWAFLTPLTAWAQSADPLNIVTITRPPFSMVENGMDVGFSVDLWLAVADDLNIEFEFTRVDVFSDMLDAVQTGTADGAIANISITAAREEVMDFTQPIYFSGLQIMVPSDTNGVSIWNILARWDVFIAIVAAFGGLWIAGMLMWLMERRYHDYFNEPATKANFPAFWWALNLVVNGGFEQVAPRRPFRKVAAIQRAELILRHIRA